MRDIVTVLRKELTELVSERHSRRSIMVQAAVALVVLGILNPAADPAAWRNASPAPVVVYLFFPGFLSAAVAADAFAGERERHTLETLLATPLSEWAILLGKVATAITLGLLLTGLAIAAAVVTLHVAGPGAHFVPPLRLFAGLIGAALASTVILTSIAVLLSMRIPIARSAQQLSGLTGIVVGGVVIAVWRIDGLALTWRSLAATEAALAAVGVAALVLARALFRRELLVERA